jgi:hypothetical protein
VPKPNPGKPGDNKNLTRKNELNLSDTQQLNHAAHAYVHVPVKIWFAIIHLHFFNTGCHDATAVSVCPVFYQILKIYYGNE